MDSIEKLRQHLIIELDMVKEEFKKLSHDNHDMENEQILLSKLFISKNLLRLIQIWKKKLDNELFYDFDGLCAILWAGHIKATDCFQILITCIENNIATGLFEKDIHKIPKFEFKVAADKSDFGECFVNTIVEDSNTEEEEYKIHCTNVANAQHEDRINSVTIEETHRIIKEHYLDKKETYTSEDMELILAAFIRLRVPTNFVQSFKIILEKEQNKRDKKQNKDTIQKRTLILKQEGVITTAQYKAIRKQIAEYYNDYTGEILKPITQEEVNYLASKMILLNWERKYINRFYEDVRRSINCLEKDSIKEFMELFPQLEFYSQKKPELKELLEEAITYHYETFGCRKEDYHFWYQAFQEVVFRLKMKIPKTFDYEYAQAEQLLKQESQNQKTLK